MESSAFAINNCTKFLQWHVDRGGMTRLFVDKSMSMEVKRKIVANLLAAVHVLFRTQLIRLTRRLTSAAKSFGFLVPVGDSLVKEWIRDRDVDEFTITPMAAAARKMRTTKENTPVGMCYVGAICGVSFKLEVSIVNDTRCMSPGCAREDCAVSCGGCGGRYCGPEHQQAHWSAHEYPCNDQFNELVIAFSGPDYTTRYSQTKEEVNQKKHKMQGAPPPSAPVLVDIGAHIRVESEAGSELALISVDNDKWLDADLVVQETCAVLESTGLEAMNPHNLGIKDTSGTLLHRAERGQTVVLYSTKGQRATLNAYASESERRGGGNDNNAPSSPQAKAKQQLGKVTVRHPDAEVYVEVEMGADILAVACDRFQLFPEEHMLLSSTQPGVQYKLESLKPPPQANTRRGAEDYIGRCEYLHDII